MYKLLLFLFLGAAGATNPITIVVDLFRSSTLPTQASINSQINESLVIINNLVTTNGLYKNFNPLDMPDVTIPVLLGQMKLTEVKEYGFNSSYRHGDATVVSNNSFIYLTVELGFTELTIDSKYALNILIVASQGKLTAKINEFVFSFSISIDRSTFYVTLENFEVKNIGTIDIKLDGSNLTDSLLATVINLLSPVFLDQARSIVGPQLRQIKEGLISEHNMAL